ncbi:MAG: ATP-binding protein [Saprospiraceae bacterium]
MENMPHNKTRYKPYYILVSALLMFIFSNAQEYKFDHYGLSQGFNASQALSIKKDKHGFVWIGTENGLYRFDGHQFKAFISDLGSNKGFSGNYINHLSIDKYNRLWMAVGTKNLNIYDIDKNEIVRYEDNNIKLGSLEIFSLFYNDKKDETWVCSNQGLFYSSGKGILLRRYIIEGLETKKVRGFYTMDDNQNMWLANEYGLFSYNQKTKKLYTFKNPFRRLDGENNHDLNTLFLEGDSIVWLGGWSTGLYRYLIKKNTWQKYNWGNPTKENNGVYQIHLKTSDPNFLWLATAKGLQLFNKQNHTFKEFITDNVYDPHRVPGVCFTLEDTESEGLWIGTWKGLHRLDPNKHFIKNKWIPNIQSFGTKAPSGICFEKSTSTNDSIIWFHLPYGEVFRYNLVTQLMVPIPTKLLPFCKGNIEPYCTYIDAQNRLWISSLHKGLIQYDFDKDEILTIKHENKEVLRVMEVVEDQRGVLYFGCDAGLYMVENNKLKEDTFLSNYLKKIKASSYVYDFTFDQNNKLWHIPYYSSKNYNTLLKYDIENQKIYSFEAKENKVLAQLDHIQQVVFVDTNKMVISSFHGFAIGEIQNNKLSLTYYDQINGRPINTCTQMVVDKPNVYISSNFGVIKYNWLGGMSILLTNNNSTIGGKTTPQLAYSKLSKTIYISQEGYLQYLLSSDIPKKKSDNLLLTSFSIQDSMIFPMPKSGDKIHMTYNQNTLRMAFSNFNFTNAMDNVYEYRMNDSKEWFRTIGHVLNFERMESGTHNLQVRSINSFNVIVDKIFVLTIIIAYPWYQTWWFQLSIVLLISSIIYSIFKYRDVQRQKVEKLRLAIARDLHDDMGSNLSHIKMLSEREAMRSTEQSGYSTIAQKTGEVMNSMSEIVWTINPKYESLQNLYGKIQEFAIDTLEPQNINVIFDVDDIPTSIKLSPENRRHYFLILKEAINNAAKYSKAKNVVLSLHVFPNQFTTSLKDDGIGFDPLLISKGNGLKNMKTRATLMKAPFHIKTDKDGTEVRLIVPKH